tara:strand:+ start:78 stop:1373 length:1296 start_codon:yes stop_codon:yes gene_type:complete
MRRWRLFFAIPASVLQLYLPGAGIGGFMPPLALLGGLALWPEFIRGIRILVKWPPTFMLANVLLTYVVSLVWSVDIRIGIRAIIYLWVFLAIFAAVVLQLRRDERVVWSLLNITVLLAIVEAVLVVVFRISPDLEMVFLHSDLARLFINPNVLDVLFTDEQNNVLDPAKAGGFFTNGNVAGAYLWIMAMVSFLLGRCKRLHLMYLSAVFLLVSALFTGSKIVIILIAVLTPAAFMAMFWHSRKRVTAFVIMTLMIGLVSSLGVLVSLLFSDYHDIAQTSLLQKADSAFDIRIKIWQYGVQAFPNSPILGQGFGGWQQEYPRYAEFVGISKNYPPHNTWIYLWSQGGLLAAVMGLGFVLSVVICGTRNLTHRTHMESVAISVAMLAAYCWVFVHGMGTNFGLIGEEHMAPVLAILLALVCAVNRNRNARQVI